MNAEYEAAVAACRALHPAKYLSDPEVMASPELTKKCTEEWDRYFAAWRQLEVKFPPVDRNFCNPTTSTSGEDLK
jgi:hypothetical protein